jgi:hypothetical protein
MEQSTSTRTCCAQNSETNKKTSELSGHEQCIVEESPGWHNIAASAAINVPTSCAALSLRPVVGAQMAGHMAFGGRSLVVLDTARTVIQAPSGAHNSEAALIFRIASVWCAQQAVRNTEAEGHGH